MQLLKAKATLQQLQQHFEVVYQLDAHVAFKQPVSDLRATPGLTRDLAEEINVL